MKVKSESEVAQSCPTLSNPMDCSLPGSSVHGIFQARVLEWGAIDPQEGCKLKTQGVDMEAPQFTADRATLSPSCPVSPGKHKCWPAQGAPDFCLEGVKEMWTLIYRLALHQRVEIPGMTFAQSCMRSVSANYAITDKFLESPTNVMGPGREQAGLSD